MQPIVCLGSYQQMRLTHLPEMSRGGSGWQPPHKEEEFEQGLEGWVGL